MTNASTHNVRLVRFALPETLLLLFLLVTNVAIYDD